MNRIRKHIITTNTLLFNSPLEIQIEKIEEIQRETQQMLE